MISNFKSEISNLIAKAKSVSKQLNGWIESLKNSKIKGSKFLTQKDRERIANDKKFAEFDEKMAEFRRQHTELLERRAEASALKRTVEEGS